MKTKTRRTKTRRIRTRETIKTTRKTTKTRMVRECAFMEFISLFYSTSFLP